MAAATNSMFNQVLGAAGAGAAGGAATSLGVVLYRVITRPRGAASPTRDELMSEGLTEIGAGTLIGAGAGVVTVLSGAGLAAVVGRGVLSYVLPGVVGALASAALREPAYRTSRQVADGVMSGARQAAIDARP